MKTHAFLLQKEKAMKDKGEKFIELADIDETISDDEPDKNIIITRRQNNFSNIDTQRYSDESAAKALRN